MVLPSSGLRPKAVKKSNNPPVNCSKGTLGIKNRISSNTKCVPPKGYKK